MRVLLLHNPGAGSGEHRAETLTRLFEDAGHRVRYRDVKKEGIAPEEAAAADLVAVAGGDGTVGKAVRALAEADRPLAILPLGTANNIAHCLGLCLPVEEIARRCGEGRERRLDLGVASGPWGREFFLEGIGLGAIAELIAAGDAADRDSEAKQRFGEEAPPRFVREAVPGAWGLRVDGRALPGEELLVEMLNMPMVGPGLPLGPSGWPEDGLVHVSILRPEGREEFARWLEGRRERPAAGIEAVMAERVELEWSGGPLRIDDRFPDQPSGPAAVRVEMMRRKLRILVTDPNGGTP